MKIVTMLSGGMDSTTLLYYLLTQFPGCEVTALGFNYGQRHRDQELKHSIAVVQEAQQRFMEWRIRHQIIDLRTVTSLLSGSSLTDQSVDVPEGHYADPTMKLTVVPNRNMMMLSIASAVAISQKAKLVAFGCHAGDHPIYPDCRPVFVDIMNLAVKLGNDGFAEPDFAVFAPFVNQSKTDIARLGAQMKVPFELTWSCYRGETTHCGACGTCYERREAFRDSGVEDPTEYQKTPEFPRD